MAHRGGRGFQHNNLGSFAHQHSNSSTGARSQQSTLHSRGRPASRGRLRDDANPPKRNSRDGPNPFGSQPDLQNTFQPGQQHLRSDHKQRGVSSDRRQHPPGDGQFREHNFQGRHHGDPGQSGHRQNETYNKGSQSDQKQRGVSSDRRQRPSGDGQFHDHSFQRRHRGDPGQSDHRQNETYNKGNQSGGPQREKSRGRSSQNSSEDRHQYHQHSHGRRPDSSSNRSENMHNDKSNSQRDQGNSQRGPSRRRHRNKGHNNHQTPDRKRVGSLPNLMDIEFSEGDTLKVKSNNGERKKGPRTDWKLDQRGLTKIVAMEPSELVMKLAAPGSGLKEFLSERDTSPELVELALQVLKKACSCSTNRNNLQHVLLDVRNSKFLENVLPLYMMSSYRLKQEVDKVEVLDYILSLLLQIISTFPASSVNSVALTAAVLNSTFSTLDSDGLILTEDVIEKMQDLNTILNHLQEKKRDGTLRSDNYTYLTGKEENIEDFRQISIFPTYDDIHLIHKPFMRPNIISETYPDSETYLDTHFRLLREDFVRPLRDGILQVLRFDGKDIRKGKFDDINVYFNAELLVPLCTPSGILYQVQFDIDMLKHVRWENSKRLLFGALVCLSSDCFETMIFATVADRNVEELKVGIITVNFTEESRLKLAEQGTDHTFLMVETTAYFEAYRHVLEGLKEMANGELPLQKYIVHCEKTLSEPQYLKNGCNSYTLDVLKDDRYIRNRQPVAVLDNKSSSSTDDDDDYSDSDCSSIQENPRLHDEWISDAINTLGIDTPPPLSPHTEASVSSSGFNILDFRRWPSKEKLSLDKSQLQALQSALTSELAIIQGPPGTGKTYVGLKIVKTLLDNSRVWQPRGNCPILVVCYTNHALDQFLEGIHRFLHTGIVRVGSRSNSELLQKFSLAYLRKDVMFTRTLPGYLRAMHAELSDLRRDAEEQIQAKAAFLYAAVKGILHENVLEVYMRPCHMKCLQLAKVPSHNSSKKSPSLIVQWLGFSVLSAKRQVEVRRGAGINVNSQSLRENEVQQLLAMVEEDDDTDVETGVSGNNSEEESLQIAEEAELVQAERMTEDDDVQKQLQSAKAKAAVRNKQILALEQTDEEEQQESTAADDEDWEITGKTRKKLKKLLKIELKKTTHMSEAEAVNIQDIWNLSLKQRWELYRLWRSKYLSELRHQVWTYENEYQGVIRRLKELRNQEDLTVLRHARVIGMTTTGAARLRSILQELRPKIVIVEEAAEVLEAHIITTLSSACQHLILIGDHQQLRPSATVYELARNFNLDVSLFERLIRMNVPYVRLDYQHRMRPEIACLLTPHIYDKLENHPSVNSYENIKGVATNLYFVEHEQLEEHIQEGKSHSNLHEASFVKALCHYFIRQGYAPAQITVLTTYTGQLFCLKKMMPRSDFDGVRVCVVDKFQGEENDIIILSLVRSNLEGRVGFLQIANRICVALSRAKKGLFCIGNMQMLSKVPLWNRIMQVLHRNNQIGRELNLRCQNHPENMCTVSKADDFKNVPEGGCMLRCEYRLLCGHVCPKFCHPYDPDHKELKCEKPCPKILCEDKHKCPKRCYEDCGSCRVPVQKVIPRCGHTQDVPCSIPPEKFSCQIPCNKTLVCGHMCVRTCGGTCTVRCPAKITFHLSCGHERWALCHEKKEAEDKGMEVVCFRPCDFTLECGHTCSGTCTRCNTSHIPCKDRCERYLFCSHRCSGKCSEDCIPCSNICDRSCPHRKCKKLCNELCSPCIQPCELSCKHSKCTRLCSEPCDRAPCSSPCDKLLTCGHACIGLCGERCPTKCRICNADEVKEIFFGNEADPNSRFIQLEDCNHVFEVTGFNEWMKPNKEDFLEFKKCPLCTKPVRNNARYNSVIKRTEADIGLVKQKIMTLWCSRLKDWLSENQKLFQYFCLESMEMQAGLQKSDTDIGTVLLTSRKLLYLSKLEEIKKKCGHMTGSFNPSVADEVLHLKKSIIAEQRGTFSSINNRILRLAVLLEATKLKKNLLLRPSGYFLRRTLFSLEKAKDEVDNVLMVLQKKEFVNDKEVESLSKTLKHIRKEMPLSADHAVLEDSEIQILDTSILRQNCWFKCSNGHVYSLHESESLGGPQHCPECSFEEYNLV
ncbi:NFX1-type zinc finger-containing protein 1-like [Protopterus annectens]|uniref:NFX1-type zinc finger-containing protein 1-like n=1 Tax=Protopterus annectens TaxID=7888 RepID=UPI001CFB90A4|nr:NFX1-type zinc finger-containing protein 1-like [Protopterus annectens]